MKKLIIIMLLMISYTHANEVKFSSELDQTRWEIVHEDDSVDKDKKIIFEFDNPYLIIKTYQDSTLESVKSAKIINYSNVNNLHFLFYSTDNYPIIFNIVNKNLYRISVDKNTTKSITLTPSRK